MVKRGVCLLLVGLFFAIFIIGGVFAQDEAAAGDAGGAGNGIENGTALDEGVLGEGETEINDAEEGGEEDIFGGEFSDAEIEVNSGITPDSSFYFVDEFFDRFGDEIEVKEEKVAEIMEMIRNGDIDSARIALERYNEHADEIESDVDPESRDDARRSASAIRNSLEEMESETSEEERKEFIEDIIEKEGGIVTAVEIASKIKSLCQELSKIDPVEYSRVCRAGDDAPNWQKKLDKELTKEQRKEAEQLFGILSQCFATQGKECRCEDISVSAFANRCSIVAPLAVKCDAGDENACESMDDATEGMEDLLPDYLQDVMERVEEKFSEEQFDNHIPGECREAGARTPKECMKVMIRLNAPPECVDELIKRDVQNEREARAVCEEIMFKEFAPEECVEAGLKNPKECGKLMFRVNAPQECIDAGLTGEQRSDEKRCREIMKGLRGPEGERHGGFGGDCRGIKSPEERLACYDGASSNVKERFERRGPSGGWPPQCEKAQAFSRESCENVMREFGEREREKHESPEVRKDIRGEFGGEFGGEAPPYDCSRVLCVEGEVCSPYRGCISSEERERELEENFGDYGNPPPGPGEPGYVDNTARYDCSQLDCGPSPNYCDPWQGCVRGEGGFNPDGSSCPEGYEYSGSGCIPFGTGDYGFANNCTEGQYYDSNGICTSGNSEPAPIEGSGTSPGTYSGTYEGSGTSPGTYSGTSEGGSMPEGGSVTGGVIFENNEFFNYYYR